MASSEATTLVTRIFDEVINQGRLEIINDLFDEEFVDHGPGGDLHGREAFRVVVSRWRAAFSDLRCEVSNIISDGDTVGWLVHTTGIHTGDALGFPATNKRIETVSPNIGIFRGGKAVEHWAEQGMLATLQQLGVVPVMAPPQPVS